MGKHDLPVNLHSLELLPAFAGASDFNGCRMGSIDQIVRRFCPSGTLQIMKSNACLFHGFSKIVLAKAARRIFKITEKQTYGRHHEDFRFAKNICTGRKSLLKMEGFLLADNRQKTGPR